MTLSPSTLHRYALTLVFATIILLIAGALVTSTGSGLSVPDWPLSFGTLFPKMEGGVFFEHGHRLIAGMVCLLYLGFMGVCFRSSHATPIVKTLAVTGLVMITLQALLGGLTVLFLLPWYLSVAHACLAQLFFSVTVLLAYQTSPSKRLLPHTQASCVLRQTSYVLTAILFAQLVMGATMRHWGAGLAIADFPLSFGKIIPPFFNRYIGIHYAHRIGGLVLLLIGMTFCSRLFLSSIGSLFKKQLSLLISSLLLLQLMLGPLIVLLARPIWLTVLHLVVGALLFATSIWTAAVLTDERLTLYHPS